MTNKNFRYIPHFLAALIPALSGCSTAQTVPGVTVTNGLKTDAPVYNVVNFPAEKRENVIMVKGADTGWAIVLFPLNEYRGKQITIELSVDVKRTGAAGTLNWQINNNGEWPSVTSHENAAVGVWHKMKGRLFVTPSDNEPCLYLTNWGNNAKNTVYYVSNFSVTITEGDVLNPDLALTPIKSVYENYFPVGNIIDAKYASGKYFEMFKHHYSMAASTVTFPDNLAPYNKGGDYRWDAADRIINLMAYNGIPVHGHVLIWHESSPEWLTTGTKDEVKSNLEQYINMVLTHFKGRINSWDVVNEAIRDGLTASQVSGNWKNCVRTSTPWMKNPWYDKLGGDYIELAFRTARAVNPDVTLYYNDYNLHDQNKAEAVRKMIKDINDRYKSETGGDRNLIEGLGMQSHYYGLDLNVEDVRKSLEKFITLGVEISISELDVSTISYQRGNGKDSVISEKDETAQAVIYAKLFSLYKEYSAYIKRVNMWGMDDGSSWISAGNPCLFDWKLNAKKAYHAVIDPEGFLDKPY